MSASAGCGVRGPPALANYAAVRFCTFVSACLQREQ